MQKTSTLNVLDYFSSNGREKKIEYGDFVVAQKRRGSEYEIVRVTNRATSQDDFAHVAGVFSPGQNAYSQAKKCRERANRE